MIKKLILLLLTLVLCFFALRSMASAAQHREVLFLQQKDAGHRTLEGFIKESMAHHFTMNGEEASFVLDYGGNNPTPTIYEMKGFVMKPHFQLITPADELNGIDLKFSVSVSSKVYREGKMGSHRFSDWRDGTPAQASGGMAWFNFQRRNGLFEYQPGLGAKNCVSRGHYQMRKRK